MKGIKNFDIFGEEALKEIWHANKKFLLWKKKEAADDLIGKGLNIIVKKYAKEIIVMQFTESVRKNVDSFHSLPFIICG